MPQTRRYWILCLLLAAIALAPAVAQVDKVDELTYPALPDFAVPEPRIGFLQEALRWWDHWLKGRDTGVTDDPDYRAYVMDGVRPQTWYADRPGRWIAETGAATAHIPQQQFHLTDLGLAQTPGSLNAIVRSPQDCGAQGGEYCAIWLGPEMPGDQRRDDALSLCFDSVPAEEAMDIVGAPRLRLRLSSDKPQAQIAVRLNHIHPDGAATRITYGVLNLCHRDGHAAPAALEPGREYDITLDLDHIAYRLPAGHKLRVAVSTAYWPLIWPAPDAATLTLSGGELSLPVRDSSGTSPEWVFPPPEADAPWQTRSLRDGNHIRRTETDMTTGTVSLIIEDDFGKVEDADHGLIGGAIARERWTIHPDDPLSARGHCHWTDEMGRGDWNLRTETTCDMWCDETTFFLNARLEAYENDVLVYERDLKDQITRDFI